MKHQFLALSLLAASGLMAQNNEMQSSQMTSSSCGDPCAPCKPCCVPQPRKCIDCECYTPSYYNLQCDWGAFVSVDFLYWYSGESGTPYAVAYTPTPAFTVGSVSTVENVPFSNSSTGTGWDPGFRVGLGWNTACDGWDLYLNWTYYHNRKGVSSSFTSPAFGQAPDIDNAVTVITSTDGHGINIPYAYISSNWAFNLNSIDLELGRKTYLSRYLTIRPFAGVRGAWTRTDLITRPSTQGAVTVANGVVANLNVRDHSINRYWGVGFVAGIQPNFYFMPNFSLFANADFALIWGKLRAQKQGAAKGVGTFGSTIVLNPGFSGTAYLSPSHYEMRQIMDLALGFSWEENWCSDRFHSEIDIGWEHHIWLNHVQRLVLNGQRIDNGLAASTYTVSPTNATIAKSDIGMGGLMVRFRFDF